MFSLSEITSLFDLSRYLDRSLGSAKAESKSEVARCLETIPLKPANKAQNTHILCPSLLHGADTWTILKADGKRLQAFHMQCQCCILGIWWSDFVTNLAVSKKTGLPDIRAVINDRKLALFGHVRHLPEGTPAYDVLHASVEAHAGMVPHPGWRRKPGRLRCTWLRDVLKVTRLTAWEAWTAADDRKERRAQRSTADYAFW